MTNEQIKKAIAEEFEQFKNQHESDENYIDSMIDEDGLSAVIFFKKEHINIFWDELNECANSELVTD